MKHFKLQFCLLISLLLLLTQPALAQLHIKVEAPTTADVEGYFNVRYTIGTDRTDGIETGGFKGFDVLSGPNTSVKSFTSIVNDRHHSEQSTTYTFTLAPQAKGTFTIPPVTIRAGGHAYRSASVTIRVTGSAGRHATPTPGGNGGRNTPPRLRQAGSGVSQSDLFIKARLGRTSVYEQEAVPLTYSFYERPGVGLNSVGLSQKPDFKGMVSQEIQLKGIDATTARLGGHTYTTGVVQQYVLFPQQAGSITIPSLTFDCVVMQQEAISDPLDAFFNGGGNIGVSLKRQSQSTTLIVKPLPTPKPMGFTGAVGHFQIKGNLITPDVRTNEMMTYRITVSGTGNLKLITAPTLVFPSDFDTYSPKTADKTQLSSTGLSGEMVFDYTFVPRNVGQYEIPETKFIYFDPAKGSYTTLLIPALKLNVKKGSRSDADLEAERALRNSDIRDIHRGNVSLRNATDYYHWGGAGYWAICGIIIVLFIVGNIAATRYRIAAGDVVATRRNKAGKMAARRLHTAKRLLDKADRSGFYTELDKALSTYLTDKLAVPTNDLDGAHIKSLLSGRGVSADVIGEWEHLEADINYARYAPNAENMMPQQLYERARTALTAMDRALSTKRPATQDVVSNSNA